MSYAFVQDIAATWQQYERFASATWGSLATGAPVLEGALVAFDCRIVERTAMGSHDVLFCAVEALAEPAEGEGLIYAARRYHAVPRTQQESETPLRRLA